MNSGDTAWILISTALVLLMTIPGPAFFNVFRICAGERGGIAIG
jgi:ammonia channel protein AmtB